MIRSRLKEIIFSFKGITLLIGIVGGIFGFISPFITDWGVFINLKWFVATILFCALIIFALLKVCVDLSSDLKSKITNSVKVISFFPPTKTFLVEMNEILGHGAMVSVFYLYNGYEIDFGTGYVKNIQEKFIQVKLIQVAVDFESNYTSVLNDIENNNSMAINKLIIKSFVRYE